MSMVGLIVVRFYGFLVFWLQIAIETFALFHHSVFFIICVSLLSFTDEVEDPNADRTYICNICNLELHQN